MKNKKASDIKWSASVKMNNGGFADTFVKGFEDPLKDLYHRIKNYNFFEEKVPFADAYRNAPYGSTFSWNGKRYKKDLQKDKEVSRQSVLDKNPVFWDNMKKEIKFNNENRYGKDGYIKYKSNELEKLNQKSLNDIIDLHIKSGNPDINIGNPNSATDPGRAFFTRGNNTLNIYGWNENKKVNSESLIDDYMEELLHARQLKDWGIERYNQHSEEDYARHNIYYDYDKKKWINYEENYDSQMYDDPKSIEGVHYIQKNGLSERLERDFDIEEKDDAYNKDARTYDVEDYITKDATFHPYEHQGDLRKLQAVLDENGYSLPKSRMKDGSYDGIFGEETKKALEKYQKDYQQGQSLPKINDKLEVWRKQEGYEDQVNIVPTHLRDKNIQAAAALQTKNSKNELPKGKTIDKTREALYNVGVKSWNSMKNGGPIKWSANTKMNNGGFTNKFVAGGQPPCGPDEAVDPKTGLCSAVTMTKNLPEVDIYSKASTRKLQGTLTDKLQQMRTAFQNSRARNMVDGDKYNFGLNLGPETNDVKELPGRIERYRQAIELEKTKYARDQNVFNQLKQFDPDTWDVKGRSKFSKSGKNSQGYLVPIKHQYEARSAEGLNTLRNAMKAGKLSKEDFMYAYNDWGKDYDVHAVQGKGPGAVYNNKATKAIWGKNMNKKSFNNLAYGLTGALTVIGGGLVLPALLPALGAVGSGVSSAGAAIAPTWTTALGTTVSQVPGFASLAGAGSGTLAGTIGNISLGNFLGASSMYGAGKGLVDGSTWDANKKVYNDIQNGEFNLKNLTNAASKDLSLLTNFSKVMPIPDLKLDKTRALVNIGQTAADPTKFDPVKFTKGLVAAGKQKYGGVVNNILKKYPNFNIHNNALDIYLKGGSVT
jgi:peptidoglycan hydrolase-like protein with peptidoglycan-binding domain